MFGLLFLRQHFLVYSLGMAVCVGGGQSLLLFDAAESCRQRLGHACFSCTASVIYSQLHLWEELSSALSNASCCVGLDVSSVRDDEWGTQILDLPELITLGLLKTRHTPAVSPKPLCRPHPPAWITSFHSPLLNSITPYISRMTPGSRNRPPLSRRCAARRNNPQLAAGRPPLESI